MQTNTRVLKKLIITLLCVCLTAFPALAAGPGEDASQATESSDTSKVLTAGAGETTAPVEETTAEAPTEAAVETGTKGTSLGIFTTTGYCNCNICSSGHNLTYSGTVPKAKHTISADLSRYPIGTKLMIGDVIYTVEDKGSSVKGNKLDIYYDTHDEALTHGVKKQEVFAVQ